MIDEDLSVFYDPDEFARMFTRNAGTLQEVSFSAIFSVVDAEALSGYALNAEFQISYPTGSVALRKGDVIADSGAPGYPPGTLWRVREHPLRVSDGLESVAPIGLEPP